MVRIARYLGINRSLDSSIEEPKRYELPISGASESVRWFDRLAGRRAPASERHAGASRFRDPLIRSGGRILF